MACEDKRALWQQADSELQQASTDRSVAQAELDAAQANFDKANAAVGEAAQVADNLYRDYLACLTGKQSRA